MPAIESNGFDSHLFETVHNSACGIVPSFGETRVAGAGPENAFWRALFDPGP